jgi:hypothetical protein
MTWQTLVTKNWIQRLRHDGRGKFRVEKQQTHRHIRHDEVKRNSVTYHDLVYQYYTNLFQHVLSETTFSKYMAAGHSLFLERADNPTPLMIRPWPGFEPERLSILTDEVSLRQSGQPSCSEYLTRFNSLI